MKENSKQSSLIPDGYLWPHTHITGPSTVKYLRAWGDPQEHTRWDALALFLSQYIPGGKVNSTPPMVQIACSFSKCSSPQVKSGLPPPLCVFLSKQQGCGTRTDMCHITASHIRTISDPEIQIWLGLAAPHSHTVPAPMLPPAPLHHRLACNGRLQLALLHLPRQS